MIVNQVISTMFKMRNKQFSFLVDNYSICIYNVIIDNLPFSYKVIFFTKMKKGITKYPIQLPDSSML